MVKVIEHNEALGSIKLLRQFPSEGEALEFINALMPFPERKRSFYFLSIEVDGERREILRGQA